MSMLSLAAVGVEPTTSCLWGTRAAVALRCYKTPVRLGQVPYRCRASEQKTRELRQTHGRREEEAAKVDALLERAAETGGAR